MFTLAHFSDPHLGPLPRPRWHELMSKRALGFTNWTLRRRGRHDMVCLAALVQDLLAQSPDHVALTGDLAVIGLPDEFVPARAFLETVGTPQFVSLVPGNHDAYVRSTAHHSIRHWLDYMKGDSDRAHDEPHFPYVRRRGPIGIVGVSSAVPTMPVSAAGKVGEKQAQAVARALAALGREGLFRVVLIHHPPVPSGAVLRRLSDARHMAEAFREAGAELVLHGHNHRPERAMLPGKDGPVTVVGVPSASAGPADQRAPGAYNLYRIDGEPGRWSCEMVVRGFAPNQEGIAERGRVPLMG